MKTVRSELLSTEVVPNRLQNQNSCLKLFLLIKSSFSYLHSFMLHLDVVQLHLLLDFRVECVGHHFILVPEQSSNFFKCETFSVREEDPYGNPREDPWNNKAQVELPPDTFESDGRPVKSQQVAFSSHFIQLTLVATSRSSMQ